MKTVDGWIEVDQLLEDVVFYIYIYIYMYIYIYAMEYYSTSRKRDIMPFATT